TGRDGRAAGSPDRPYGSRRASDNPLAPAAVRGPRVRGTADPISRARRNSLLAASDGHRNPDRTGGILSRGAGCREPRGRSGGCRGPPRIGGGPPTPRGLQIGRAHV